MPPKTKPKKDFVGETLKLIFTILRGSFWKLAGIGISTAFLIAGAIFLMERMKGNHLAFVLFILTVLSAAIFVSGSFALEAFTTMNGEKFSFPELLSESRKRFWKFTVASFKSGLFVVASVGVILLLQHASETLVKQSLYYLLLLMPATLLAYFLAARLYLHSMILYPVLLFENLSFREAWSRTKELTNNKLLVLFFVSFVYYALLNFAMIVPLSAFTFQEAMVPKATVLSTGQLFSVSGISFFFFLFFLLPTAAYGLLKKNSEKSHPTKQIPV